MRFRIPRLLRHPVPWLLLLFVRVWAALRENAFLRPGDSPDTISYDLISRMPLAEALSSIRSLGYPLFLRGLRLFSDDYSFAPTAHLLLYFAAVLLFWFAISRYTGSRWLAFAWALPLVYPCNLGFVRFVQPDFMGPTVATVAMALVILLAKEPANRFLWVLVALAVFSSYQMRPDNLFLVVLAPAWGALLLIGRRIFDGRRLLRVGAALALATVLPLLAFMGLRWMVVGQFSLVPFGGYNLVGITASFLDPELVERLPEESRPLAGEILAKRQAGKREPYRLESWTRRWHQQYSGNVWKISEPIARRLLTDAPEGPIPPLAGDAAYTINTAFKSLSRQAIRLRPQLYLKWVSDSFRVGLETIFGCTNFGYLLVLAALAVPIMVVRGWNRGFQPSRKLEDRMLQLLVLATLVTTYFLAKLLLTVLVSVPYERYVMPGMAFLPCVLTAGLFELGRWLLAPPSQGTAD